MAAADRLIERFGRAPVLAAAVMLGVLLLALAVLAAVRSTRHAPTGVTTSAIAVAVPVDAAEEATVSVTALEPVWLKVYQPQGEVLFMGELGTGQSYELPPEVDDAMLWTGRPHAVEVRLGDTLLPVLGPPGRPLKDVSLARDALRARIPAPPPLPPVRSSTGYHSS